MYISLNVKNSFKAITVFWGVLYLYDYIVSGTVFFIKSIQGFQQTFFAYLL